jgi:phenylacetate-coenzyme A ligase PaaK-like adenylate-forming protein
MAEFDRILTDKRLHLGDIERHLASRQAGGLLLGQYRACATGGTTGERAVLVYDQSAWEIAAANYIRFLRAVGVVPETRFVGIGSPSPLHLSNRMFAELREGRAATPLLSVTTPLPDVVATLNAFQPEALITYPSFIRRLVEEQTDGRLRIAPRLMGSVAETLQQDVRDLVRLTWGIGIFDGFGTTETGTRGLECEYLTGIHLPEDLIVYEVVDEANRRVAPGVTGSKILITTLTNKVLPLIRYELSDMVSLAEGVCRCGRPYVRIASIEGRREEVLKLPARGGGYVDIHAGRLRSPLVRIPGIRQFQVTHRSYGLDIKISIREDRHGDEILTLIQQEIRSALLEAGADVPDIRVQLVDTIERVGTGAKERLVTRST